MKITQLFTALAITASALSPLSANASPDARAVIRDTLCPTALLAAYDSKIGNINAVDDCIDLALDYYHEGVDSVKRKTDRFIASTTDLELPAVRGITSITLDAYRSNIAITDRYLKSVR